MRVILGKKLEMTQRYDAAGRFIPVTVVQAGPCVVLQVKEKNKDGYSAVQIAFDKKRKVSKSIAGHQKEFGKEGEYWRHLREFRTEEISLKPGDLIKVEAFKPGDLIKVTGISRGLGYAGVVKRHHFHGHPPTHGHKDAERMPGSIGAGGHQHVDKGRRMAGRMGGDQVTVRNLEVVEVDLAKNLLFIKGPLPGAKNALLMIQEV